MGFGFRRGGKTAGGSNAAKPQQKRKIVVRGRGSAAFGKPTVSSSEIPHGTRMNLENLRLHRKIATAGGVVTAGSAAVASGIAIVAGEPAIAAAGFPGLLVGDAILEKGAEGVGEYKNSVFADIDNAPPDSPLARLKGRNCIVYRKDVGLWGMDKLPSRLRTWLHSRRMKKQ